MPKEVMTCLESMKKPLYPTEDSLAEAINRINQALPEISQSRLTPLINTYHNTLISIVLKELNK